MRDINPDNWPTLPLPNGWLMGLVAIGGGITLWWLNPGMRESEEDRSRALSGEHSPWERFPDSTRASVDRSWRPGGVLLILGGLAVLGFRVAHL